MRAYFWTNFYMSPIQHGIQAQHCTAELFLKYTQFSTDDGFRAYQSLCEWAENWKTTVIKNGGDIDGMYEVLHLMGNATNPFAWDCFYESGVHENFLSCVGIILPERIYEKADLWRKKEFEWNVGLSLWEEELVKLIASTGLAR